MKFWWWRGVPGKLTITGAQTRCTCTATAGKHPEAYGDIGFQATALIFPTVGCWQVKGHEDLVRQIDIGLPVFPGEDERGAVLCLSASSSAGVRNFP
jgi:hypothetical protein